MSTELKHSLHISNPVADAVNCGGGSIVSQSGQRSLWCDMPQVAASSLLHTISPQTRRLQVTIHC